MMSETAVVYPKCPVCGSENVSLWTASSDSLSWFTCNKCGNSYSDGEPLTVTGFISLDNPQSLSERVNEDE